MIEFTRQECKYLKKMLDRKVLGCNKVLDDKEYLLKSGKTAMIRRAKLAYERCTSIIKKLEEELREMPVPDDELFNDI